MEGLIVDRVYISGALIDRDRHRGGVEWATLHDNSYTFGPYFHGKVTVPWDLVEESSAVLFVMEASDFG